MAKKHVEEYYEKISNDYVEMVHTLEELQESGAPEANVEQIRQMVNNVKENFQRWSYMMYLLNMPTKKEKLPRYQQRSKKLLDKVGDNSVDAELQENQKTLEELNNLKMG